MRSILLVLVVIQMIGIVAAAIAAVVDIETIVATGPILSVIGLLLASLSYCRNMEVGFLFGLSVPSMSVLCFAIILGLALRPAEAQFPIGSLIVLFAFASAPLGFFAVRENRRSPLGNSMARFQLQFHIKTLLGLTLITAILLGLYRASAFVMAIGIIAVYTALASYAVKCFYRNRVGERTANHRTTYGGVTPGPTGQ